MKRILLITFILFAAHTINAQVEYSSNSQFLKSAPVFSIDAASYKSSKEGKSRVDFFIQVPYANIQFVKKGSEFLGGYNITLTFYTEDKSRIMFESMWKEKLSSGSFEEANSGDNFNISYKFFDLTPGKYNLKCTVEDSDSRKSSSREFPLNIREIADSLDISDLLLVTDVLKDSLGESIVPNVGRMVTNKTSELSVYLEIYSSKNQQAYIDFTMKDIKNGKDFNQLSPQELRKGINKVIHTFTKTDFVVGDYSILAVLKNSEWKEIKSTEKTFISKIFGVPSGIADLDKAIDQMLYIASPNQLDDIKDSKTYEEKLNRFLAFWQSKKPSQSTEENPVMYEYYRRIDYASKTFKGLGEGWRSDMGMIYVTFGPPNNVDRHPIDAYSKPYEVWEYYEINRSFVFSDNTGFGNYRLVNPDFSRWPGYRY
ncbi:MAG: GWxTD domain-containing protein [Melioribacteraceae bacterium]|nr:GWxTD domain-containing protein [Melioribacteraceae bacterium]